MPRPSAPLFDLDALEINTSEAPHDVEVDSVSTMDSEEFRAYSQPVSYSTLPDWSRWPTPQRSPIIHEIDVDIQAS